MNDVHGNLTSMREIPAGEFKQHCLRLMDEVAETGEHILITKRGKPVAELAPARAERPSWVGSMRGRMEIVGDIVSPVIDLDDIEALRD